MKFVEDARLALALVAVGAGLAAALSIRQPGSLRRRARGAARAAASPSSSSGFASSTYTLPEWVPSGVCAPKQRLRLAHLPTPLHTWPLPRLGRTELWIKRDDCTGCELSGNKIRKLEFLLAEAVTGGCDCVITVGGIQSNHCRATAAAARRVGLEPHIILRTSTPDQDPGLVGNLMVDRMVGAQIHLVGDEEFAQEGGWKLVCALRDKLVRKDRKPYCFPSGGSNDVGTWGYVEAIHELQQQAEAATVHLDRIYFACGSGGTAAGLALGLLWSGLAEAGTELVGLGVDDTPDDFYAKLDGIFQEMQVPKGTPPARKLLRIEQRIGEGYAKSTHAELEYIVEVARATGVVLDPVYSGKAALGMVEDLQARPCDRAVFIHTGGLLGLYAKEEQLGSLISGGWHSFTRE